MDAITHHTDGAMSLTGKAVDIYGAVCVRSALRMHVATNGAMRLTRGATPTAMVATARTITGVDIAARDYAGAITALDHWITEAKVKVQHIQGA